MLNFLPLSVEADVLNLGSFVYCKKFVFKGKLLNGKKKKISPGKLQAGTREDLSLHNFSSDFFEGSANQLISSKQHLQDKALSRPS